MTFTYFTQIRTHNNNANLVTKSTGMYIHKVPKTIFSGGIRTHGPLFRWQSFTWKKPNLLVLIRHEMGHKLVAQLKEAGWLDYAIFFLHFGHTEIRSWATSLSPVSCQIRTKRLGKIFRSDRAHRLFIGWNSLQAWLQTFVAFFFSCCQTLTETRWLLDDRYIA
jgi:hypothetical protein